jgi:aryl-alcohol dehydrogenase-like predicted oxidoreductase
VSTTPPRRERERMVIASKLTMARAPDNPNFEGNPRLKHGAVSSLRQLGTDRLDLLYLHGWYMTTQPDEVMRGLDDLVQVNHAVAYPSPGDETVEIR